MSSFTSDQKTEIGWMIDDSIDYTITECIKEGVNMYVPNVCNRWLDTNLSKEVKKHIDNHMINYIEKTVKQKINNNSQIISILREQNKQIEENKHYIEFCMNVITFISILNLCIFFIH